MTGVVSKGGLMHTICHRIRALKSLLSHPFRHGEKSRGRGQEGFSERCAAGCAQADVFSRGGAPVLMRFLSMQACQAHAKAQQ